MQTITVFAAVLAVAAANPQIIYNAGLGFNGYNGYPHGLTYAAAPAVVAAPVPVATKSQYHAQDELGQASWGHSEPGQAHAAVRDATGGVSGSFSYVDPHGLTRTTHYRADQNGYRVVSNNLPVAPAAIIAGPVDTPEVHAAKVAHAAAHADALVRSGRKKRGVVSSYTIPSAAVYSAVHAPVVAAAPAYTYASAVHAPVVRTVASPVAYTSAIHAPVAYSSAVHSPIAYTAGIHAPVVAHSAVVAAPAVRTATLTKVINTPGHAVSYRVD